MEHPEKVGKYEIERFLGGGMSRVYRAKDTVLGRHVALKILTDAAVADPEMMARFLFEARTASNINHENVISVYDFGEDSGRPFLVLEFLDGESLREKIRHGRLGDFEWRMKIALQVAYAVEFIHSRKIVHRDIKPENVHVEPSGRVKLMDFGIAKSEGMQLTKAGFTVGTPYYMAPEQVMGHPLTRQSDVYSFGVLLFELLTGTRPVNGTTVQRIFDQILREPLNLAPLRALRLPPEVCDLIAKCTEKNPGKRPQGLGPVCATIAHILNPNPVAHVPLEEPPPAEDDLSKYAAIALAGGTALAVVAIVYLICRWIVGSG